MRDTANAIHRLLQRVRLVFGVGRTTVGDDAGSIQTHQVKLSDIETHDKLKRLMEFGFTSNPPLGSDVLVAFLGGDRSNGVIIATGHQATRLKNLAPGEAALYDAFGKSIWLKENEIVIEAGGKPVTISNASDINLTGSGNLAITVAGDVTVNATGSATVEASDVTVTSTGTAVVNAPLFRVNGDIEASGSITDHA